MDKESQEYHTAFVLHTLRKYRGKRVGEIRNPHFTVRQCICLADYVAALEERIKSRTGEPESRPFDYTQLPY